MTSPSDTQRPKDSLSIEDLRVALQRYGRHEHTCDVSQRGYANGAACSCGWDNVDRAIWAGTGAERKGDAEALAALRGNGS
jgi:hypothetical protein